MNMYGYLILNSSLVSITFAVIVMSDSVGLIFLQLLKNGFNLFRNQPD